MTNPRRSIAVHVVTVKSELRWRATVDDGSFFSICDATNEALAIAGALRLMADHYDAQAKVSA